MGPQKGKRETIVGGFRKSEMRVSNWNERF